MALPVAFKRPAAQQAATKRSKPSPAQYTPESAPPLASSPAWAQAVPAPHPSWAAHAVSTLRKDGHFPARAGREKTIELNVWSDCSGINSEMFALRELSAQLRALVGVVVKWVLYCTCDSDPKSRRFSELNHDPVHVSDWMEHRNIETGQFWCEKHGDNHDLPKGGLDLYVGTYPCSPWARRGKRTGFTHPDAQATIIGFKSIGFMQPAVFVIELGEMPSQNALEKIMETLKSTLQAAAVVYSIQVVRNLTPAWSGYPTRRKRLFIIGWRADIDGTSAAQPLQSLVAAPLHVEHSFLRFLRLERGVDWSRVGECPSGEELSKLSASPCRCGLDPMVCCPVHPCRCGRCGDSGTECVWRAMCVEYMARDALAGIFGKKKGMLTYLQVMEMQGREGPDNPRRRLLINLFALQPGAHPLNETLMLGDISQNPPMGDLFSDGETPVFTTSSNVWVFQTGEILKTSHAAALMGLDLSTVKLSHDMGEPWFRQRLGLAVHVANFGLVLLAALAPPLQVFLSVSRSPQ